jgi:hypothetical protein
VTSLSGRSEGEVEDSREKWGGLLGEVNGDNSKQCFATCLKLPCPNLVISEKLSDLICSVVFFIHNYLKDIYLMSNIYLSLP